MHSVSPSQRHPREVVIATMRTGRRCLYVTNFGRCVSDGQAGSALQLRAAVTPPLTAAAVSSIADVCHRLSDLTSGDHNATTRDRVHDAHEHAVTAIVRAHAGQPIACHRTLHTELYLPHSTRRSVTVPFVMPPPRVKIVRADVSAPLCIEPARVDPPAVDLTADDALVDDTDSDDAFSCDTEIGRFSLETGWSF